MWIFLWGENKELDPISRAQALGQVANPKDVLWDSGAERAVHSFLAERYRWGGRKALEKRWLHEMSTCMETPAEFLVPN